MTLGIIENNSKARPINLDRADRLIACMRCCFNLIKFTHMMQKLNEKTNTVAKGIVMRGAGTLMIHHYN